MAIHLDVIGGVAGDMFIAGILSAYPELETELLESLAGCGLLAGVHCHTSAHHDGVLVGKRFFVQFEQTPKPLRDDSPESPTHLSEHPIRANQEVAASPHAHVHWDDLRKNLETARLSKSVVRHAIGIFELLAAAEAEVHGTTVGEVAFHEVGALDSIADIVGAAWLIDQLGAHTWTVSELPLGSGRIRTGHGILPVPAPATALLLRGYRFFDDGLVGERITPTGAAILRYLCKPGAEPRSRGALQRTGFGFGTKRFAGISNVVRVLGFVEAGPDQAENQVVVLEFEVDDQTPEDLAIGLDEIRRIALDVIQTAALGKKGRQIAHIQILAELSRKEEVVASCFAQTTTLGIRVRTAERITLARREVAVPVKDQEVRVKVVERTKGVFTGKAEAEDWKAGGANHAERSRVKMDAENRALGAKPSV